MAVATTGTHRGWIVFLPKLAAGILGIGTGQGSSISTDFQARRPSLRPFHGTPTSSVFYLARQP